MTQYFFHLNDGDDRPDDTGAQLDDPREAEREAVLIAAEWLKDHPGVLLDRGAMQVTVADAAGLTLMHVEISVRRSAANAVTRRNPDSPPDRAQSA